MLSEIKDFVRGQRILLEWDVVDARPVRAGVKFDPDTVTVSLYDPTGQTVVGNAAATKRVTGIYQYTWPSGSGSPPGRYTVSATCTWESGAATTTSGREEAFDLLTQ